MKKHNFRQRGVSQDPWKAFYMVFCESLGLAKVDDCELSFVILFILTELVDGIFSHPYFQVYVIQHMKEDKETDGKLRAFVFVEQCHLKTYWAYKAIKAEIDILHRRLIRINQQLRTFEFSKHFLDEDSDQEEENPLVTTTEADELHHKMENIALEQLRANQPVVMFKKIADAQKKQTDKSPDVEDVKEPVEEIKEDQALLEGLDGDESRGSVASQVKQKQQEAELVEEKIRMLVGELKRQVHLQNRLDLYHKERIGLRMAVQSGAIQVLEQKGDSAFYSRLVDREKATFTQIVGEGQRDTDGSFSAVEAIYQGSDNEVRPPSTFSKRWNA
jgi:hypothetical protein